MKMNEEFMREIWYRIRYEIPWIGKLYEKLIGKKRLEKIHQNQNKKLRAYGIEVIQNIEEILPDLGVKFFIDFGSLWGMFRDKKLIDYDWDIDYSLIITENFSWNNLETTLINNGYKKVKEWKLDGKITEQCYELKGVRIDFFGRWVCEDKMTGYTYGKASKLKKYNEYNVYSISTPNFSDTIKLNIDNFTVTIPTNTEQYLSLIYGDNWMIPDPNCALGPAIHYLENKVGIRKFFYD